MKRQPFPDKQGYWVHDPQLLYSTIEIYYLTIKDTHVELVNMTKDLHEVVAKQMRIEDLRILFNHGDWYYIGPWDQKEFRKLYNS